MKSIEKLCILIESKQHYEILLKTEKNPQLIMDFHNILKCIIRIKNRIQQEITFAHIPKNNYFGGKTNVFDYRSDSE